MTLFNDLDTGEERVLMTPDIINILGLDRPKINGNETYPRIMIKLDQSKLEYRVLDKATGVTYLCSKQGLDYLINSLSDTEYMKKPLYTLSIYIKQGRKGVSAVDSWMQRY